jgi:putative ABC transport system permease protein
LRGAWRYGLANVGRRALSSAVQTAALGLGLMAILLLTLVRTDLVSRWQAAIPEDAPNRFIINVQPDQVEPVTRLLAERGVAAPTLFPMVRARLLAVNGSEVSGADYEERGERARRLAEREFNLSMDAAFERKDNAIVAGEAWPASGARPDQFSVEEGIAEALGWTLGDRIRFDIAGRMFEGDITSLRRVDWESFRPNFFVLAPAGALDGYPASWITAVHAPASEPGLTTALLRAFPNLTVIDVDAVLAQVRSTADQVATAIEYVFYFTLVAGLLVLIAAVTATQDERLLEGGVMRVLGASARQLRLAQASEFAVVGLIAGLTAAIAAAIVSGLIAEQVFDLPWAPDWRLALVGGFVGLVAVTVTGLLATRRVVTASPNATLRSVQD